MTAPGASTREPAANIPVIASSSARGTKSRDRYRSRRYDAISSAQVDMPRVPVDRHRRSRRDPARRPTNADDAGNAELARDDGAVRQHAAALHDQPRDEEERRRPTGIRLSRDQDLAAL